MPKASKLSLHTNLSYACDMTWLQEGGATHAFDFIRILMYSYLVRMCMCFCMWMCIYIYICMMYVCVFLFKAGQGSGREGQHDRTGWRGCSNELWMVQEIRLNTRPMLVYTCYKCNLEGHYNGFGMICSSFSSSQIDMNSHLYHGEWV